MSENNPLDNVRPPLDNANESSEFIPNDQIHVEPLVRSSQIGENQTIGTKEEKPNVEISKIKKGTYFYRLLGEY